MRVVAVLVRNLKQALEDRSSLKHEHVAALCRIDRLLHIHAMIEDELDAYLCSYIGLYYWTHGTSRCRVVGDVESGYVVLPVTVEKATQLDSWTGTKAKRKAG